MSSIQERLQLKRVPLDTWNIKEQLCLASAVVRSGDQNWMSVSRALKTIGEANRPPDWYSQKSCAAQYGALLEHVETPKRKKRSSEGAVETPQESILKRLTQERIVEIQRTVAEMNQQYELLKTEITEARNPATSEERLHEMWAEIEAAKRTRERENARRAAWLKEREERRARAERTWRPPQGGVAAPVSSGGSGPPSSPLLTSLLKSSPVVTTPQHISHPANVVETVSPSAGAPTLSMLLEKTPASEPSPQDNKTAAIEHIKSQLVQIEQQLKANTGAPAVDIDDIEIKAEDVYAFRDVDIHLPPVAHIHKPTNRPAEKPAFKKDDQDTTVPMDSTTTDTVQEEIKEEPVQVEQTTEEVVTVDVETVAPDAEQSTVDPPAEPAARIGFPEVKFPAPEIKIVREEHQIKEEVKETESVTEEDQDLEVNVEDVSVTDNTESQDPPPEPEVPPPEPAPQEPEKADDADTVQIPLPESPTKEDGGEQTADPPAPPQEEIQEQKIEEEKKETEEAQEVTQDIKVEDSEEPLPPKDPGLSPDGDTSVAVKNEPNAEVEDTHTETDDDTPMELSREEEKDGKKKRDYSRKKKPDSRTCSGSESAAEASAPDSPSGTDADRQHRLWKKSVMLVYSRLCAHKYASIFLRPISDEEAPGYSMVIKKPMDLTTIRRNIEQGIIRTTAEFQRDVLLMLSNALMYNHTAHSVYQMARDMHEEASNQLGMLVAAQAHAGLVPPPATRKRRRHSPPPTSTSQLAKRLH